MDQLTKDPRQKFTFKVGDLVRVTTRDIQDTKAHPSSFEGTVLAMHGRAIDRTFTVRKIATGNVAVERIFPINSPSIQDIKVIKAASRVRRAKLYYLRK